MRAILVGASGLIGGLLLEKLLDNAAFSAVKVIARHPLNLQDPKLETCLINFEDEAAFRQAVTPADVLFCCVGTTQKKVNSDKAAYRKVDFDIPARAAKFCAEQAIPQFLLVSSVGASAGSGNFYLALKGETETAVLRQSIPTVYIMRPSILLGNRKEARPGEIMGKIIMRFFSLLLLGSTKKYKAIQAADVATAMLLASQKKLPGKFILEYTAMKELVRPALPNNAG